MTSRLAAVTGLFLALAAIQFVVDQNTPSSSYVTALQQLVLASYVCLILVGIENVVIWYITIYHQGGRPGLCRRARARGTGARGHGGAGA